MAYWSWPTSFGYVVIDDQYDARDNHDALIGWGKKTETNVYGEHSVPKLYCYYCRSFMCSHINVIRKENV